MVFASCDRKENIYKFDFTHKWTWSELKNHASNLETKKQIESLKRIISVEEARDLFFYLSNLDNPTDVKQLSQFQSVQDSLGGSTLGLTPNFPENADTIPIPYDFDKLISLGLFLAEFREASYNAIEKTNYPLTFNKSDLVINNSVDTTSNIKLVFDFSCVKQILNAFDEKSCTFKKAIEISNLPGFKHMLNHRKNLGYIPEPLPTSESLAHFIFYASSREPLNMIWKWISPWNYFNLSDLYMNRKDYSSTITKLESKKHDLLNLISNKISPFVPEEYKYKDTLTIAVNWGIRSWATEHTLGTNIVQFKDDFDLLIRTISHESFHKIQLELCPCDSASVNKIDKSFEDIVNFTFPDNKDSKFYQAISYIFLEGTASYVGGMDTADISENNAKVGANLLNDIYNKIYVESNPGEVDEILNKGLKSNGPFYVLGYLMTEKIVNHSDPEKIRKLLLNGPLKFFSTYIEMNKKIAGNYEVSIELTKDIENKIKELTKKFEL